MTNDEQIKELQKGFRPVFGDADSLHIMELGKKRDRLLVTVKKNTKSFDQIERAAGKKKQADRDLELCEKNLIHALERFASK